MVLCNLKKQKQSACSRSALLGHWPTSKELGATSPLVHSHRCGGRESGMFLLHTSLVSDNALLSQCEDGREGIERYGICG